jgi:hypothetical protein
MTMRSWVCQEFPEIVMVSNILSSYVMKQIEIGIVEVIY